MVGASELLYAVLLLLEWRGLALGSQEAELAYHFGSEAMVGEGGILYRSRFAYESYALAAGCVGVGTAGLTVYAMVRQRWSAYLSLAIVVAIQAAAEWLLRR